MTGCQTPGLAKEGVPGRHQRPGTPLNTVTRYFFFVPPAAVPSPPEPPVPSLRICPPLNTLRWSKTTPQNIRFWDIGKGGGAVDLVEKSLYTADYQRLCALLVRLRRDAGLTQVRVADALGVPQSFVSKYESGQRRLDVIELDHIAAALGTTLHAIVDALKAPNGTALEP